MLLGWFYVYHNGVYSSDSRKSLGKGRLKSEGGCEIINYMFTEGLGGTITLSAISYFCPYSIVQLSEDCIHQYFKQLDKHKININYLKPFLFCNMQYFVEKGDVRFLGVHSKLCVNF